MISPHRRVSAGLTIIEMMVVVAVVAVLATLAAPSFRSMIAMQRVKGVNAELVTDLQFARSEAVRRHRSVFVRFDNAASCYVLYTDATTGSCVCSNTPVCTSELGREEIKTVKLPAANGVSINSDKEILRFWPAYAVLASSSSQVSVVSSLRGQLRTEVNEAGRPSVCTPDSSISGVPTCP